MARSYTHFVQIRKWFPPSDPLAAQIARLCILREDCLFEMLTFLKEGAISEEGGLGFSVRFRRLYFYRNNLRTLTEISGGIQKLMNNADFRQRVSNQRKELRDKFAHFQKLAGSLHATLKAIRNEVCGHVLESAVQEALTRLESDWDTSGYLHIGERIADSRYPFSLDLVGAVLRNDVPPELKLRMDSKRLVSVTPMIQGLEIADCCIAIYLLDRGLLGSDFTFV